MNQPDPRGPKATQAQLDGALAALAANSVLFVSSIRMRLAQVHNPLKPDLPIRFLECHLSLQDRDEKVIWAIDKESLQQIADQFNMLLDEKTGAWAEELIVEEATEIPEEQLEEIKKTFGEGVIMDEVNNPDTIEAAGTLPMGINRPEETGEDGEFTYLKSVNGEDLDD